MQMKRWYVAQVYAGYEEAIKTDLERRIEQEKMHDIVGQILIPSTKLRPLFDPQEEETQLFPGYLLVEMECVPEAMRLVQSHSRVIQFLGGKTPVPLTAEEVARIFSQVKGDVPVIARESGFKVGTTIEVKEGPFAGFFGVIDEIDEENERLKVMVSIFGRMTPIELEFQQVKQ
jgi:transcriptional antiterminator NusG